MYDGIMVDVIHADRTQLQVLITRIWVFHQQKEVTGKDKSGKVSGDNNYNEVIDNGCALVKSSQKTLIIPHRAVQLDEDSADGNYNKGTGNRCIMTTQYTASILEGKVWV